MKEPDSPWKAISLVTIIGADLAVLTLVGIWLGKQGDQYFDTAPWLMIIGMLIGLAAGIVTIVPIIRRFLGDQTDV